MEHPPPDNPVSRDLRVKDLLAKARDAEDRSAKSRNPAVRNSWQVVATEYRKLAKSA